MMTSTTPRTARSSAPDPRKKAIGEDGVSYRPLRTLRTSAASSFQYLSSQ